MEKDRDDDEFFDANSELESDDEFFDARSEFEPEDIDHQNLEDENVSSYLQGPFKASMSEILKGLNSISAASLNQKNIQLLSSYLKKAGLELLIAADKTFYISGSVGEMQEIATIASDWYQLIKEAPKKGNQILNRVHNECNRALERLSTVNGGLEKGEKGVKWILEKFNNFAKATIKFLKELPSSIKKICKDSIDLVYKKLKSIGKLFSQLRASQVEQSRFPTASQNQINVIPSQKHITREVLEGVPYITRDDSVGGGGGFSKKRIAPKSSNKSKGEHLSNKQNQSFRRVKSNSNPPWTKRINRNKTTHRTP